MNHQYRPVGKTGTIPRRMTRSDSGTLNCASMALMRISLAVSGLGATAAAAVDDADIDADWSDAAPAATGSSGRRAYVADAAPSPLLRCASMAAPSMLLMG